MRSRHVYHAVDSHTEGMPTRVITGGLPVFPGATMAERRAYLMEHRDDLRKFFVQEPRGHSAMSGAFLQPPTRPDADVGVLFVEVSGWLPMCGHGTIGVCTVLVETGMVEVTEPVTTIRLDAPAGLVTAQVAVKDGHAESVTLANVPSFAAALDAKVEVPGYGTVTYDLAFGGNFYAWVRAEDLGVEFTRDNKDGIMRAGMALMAAINEHARPQHPADERIGGVKHVGVLAPGSTPTHTRHAMVIHPGWFDRSPCGTGTSARLAQLHARGELKVGEEMVNESFIGTHFTARITGETEVAGIPAIHPSITGRAWVTGTAQYLLDPSDPFPYGFAL
ncbi:proline racemase [Actinorhabdospora filicis]|uniref:Proline racemase n=1 Tax=Actinorhabdospora filicis TaxID=1785913 RepID=A0A9W6SNM9_9ACTN|nr:proline racemase family protein [Actinorhabdospora filicis]GLZ79212.1 proline racemase [Actinorhabdospora filicis]